MKIIFRSHDILVVVEKCYKKSQDERISNATSTKELQDKSSTFSKGEDVIMYISEF